jgi:hypothetical protein
MCTLPATNAISGVKSKRLEPVDFCGSLSEHFAGEIKKKKKTPPNREKKYFGHYEGLLESVIILDTGFFIVLTELATLALSSRY